jgi:hypothetical protein
MGKIDGQEVRCNIVVSMVDGSVTVSAEGDDLGEDKLTDAANKLFAELDKLLA